MKSLSKNHCFLLNQFDVCKIRRLIQMTNDVLYLTYVFFLMTSGNLVFWVNFLSHSIWIKQNMMASVFPFTYILICNYFIQISFHLNFKSTCDYLQFIKKKKNPQISSDLPKITDFIIKWIIFYSLDKIMTITVAFARCGTL